MSVAARTSAVPSTAARWVSCAGGGAVLLSAVLAGITPTAATATTPTTTSTTSTAVTPNASPTPPAPAPTTAPTPTTTTTVAPAARVVLSETGDGANLSPYASSSTTNGKHPLWYVEPGSAPLNRVNGSITKVDSKQFHRVFSVRLLA